MKGPVLFQNQPALQIESGPDQVTISDHGARVLRWLHQGREVITWPEDADWSQFLKVRGGNPILFPFAARHFVDGVQNLWKDAEGIVRPLPIHGFARQETFALVEDKGENSFRLRLRDSAETRAAYPFSFQLDVVVTLRPRSRLEFRLETTNCDERPLPYYPGHHFYFAVPHAERSQWQLHLPCASWARQTATGAIVHEEPKAESFSLDDPALIDRFQVHPLHSNIVLAHVDGKRRLVLELKSAEGAPWHSVVTWTESPTSNFYCIEPWLGLPNAIHHGEGLRWIGPGRTETAICVLDASEWT